MKVSIQRKVLPIEVVRGDYPYLIKSVNVFFALKKTHIQLPEGTLVRSITYYGARGPRQAKFSIDNGDSWIKGFVWSDLPLSEGAKIQYA